MATAVIFDLDGVLVDSRAAIGGSINHALDAHGLPPLRDAELAPLIGPPLLFSFAGMLGTTAADPIAEQRGGQRQALAHPEGEVPRAAVGRLG